ncbi:hypothetical protein ACFXKD_13485 [Nocardiopsis aegyptia]|uniref:hypothetical protein n=1 Tax=Nocardiopsis aegyptia TaxID=220378 RepID=UPI003671B451
MRILVVTIFESGLKAPPPGLTDILWALTRPEEQVEHIHVASAAGKAVITYFVLAPNDLAALRMVSALTGRALAHAPSLRGWRLSGA